jgi:hypothetical protein
MLSSTKETTDIELNKGDDDRKCSHTRLTCLPTVQLSVANLLPAIRMQRTSDKPDNFRPSR